MVPPTYGARPPAWIGVSFSSDRPFSVVQNALRRHGRLVRVVLTDSLGLHVIMMDATLRTITTTTRTVTFRYRTLNVKLPPSPPA